MKDEKRYIDVIRGTSLGVTRCTTNGTTGVELSKDSKRSQIIVRMYYMQSLVT
jgi:hypothetical protein